MKALSKTRTLLTIGALTIGMGIGCGKQTGVAGTWTGTVDTSSFPRSPGEAENKPIRIVLNLSGEETALKASISTPDESPEVVQAESAVYSDHSLTVRIPRRQSVYEVKLNAAGTELHGRFKQGDYDLPLAFTRS
jgi:hypothetical protein